jgi:hypothetical protein
MIPPRSKEPPFRCVAVLQGDPGNPMPWSGLCSHDPRLPSTRAAAAGLRRSLLFGQGGLENAAAAYCVPAVGWGRIRPGRIASGIETP